MDLLIGEYNGNINLYQNIASSGNVNLQLVTDSVGKITTTSEFMPFGYSSVSVEDVDGDGRLDIWVGGFNNVLNFVSNIQDSIMTKVYSVKIETLPETIGRRIVPFYTNVTSQNDGTLLLGLLAGGIRWMSQNAPIEEPVKIKGYTFQKLDFSIYPNPITDYLTVEIPTFQQNIQWTVMDMMGRVCANGKVNDTRTEIYLQNLTSGAYLLHLSNGNGSTGNQLFIKSK